MDREDLLADYPEQSRVISTLDRGSNPLGGLRDFEGGFPGEDCECTLRYPPDILHETSMRPMRFPLTPAVFHILLARVANGMFYAHARVSQDTNGVPPPVQARSTAAYRMLAGFVEESYERPDPELM